MSYAIGIDLGTSNSTAAIYRKGKVESIPIDGKKLMPSVVSIKDSGEILTGQKAKARLYIDPENSVSSSKRNIGNPGVSYNIQGNKFTPVDIAKEILLKIKKEASSYLGEDIKEAVITIPAYFTEDQRKATKVAGEQAGFKVLRLLPEPTAAAIAYGMDKEKDQTIAVYDLGGGTFDVSILKVEGNNFRVLAVDGDSELGGDDFDEAIFLEILSRIKLTSKIANSLQETRARQQLKEAVEQAKVELSESEVADITIPDFMGTHIDEELDRDTYNQLIASFINQTIYKTEDAIKQAGLTVRDISRVILVGGSTRNTIVREIVAKRVKQPFIADNVDEVVAQGAAIMAANLFSPEDSGVPIEIKDVQPHTLGVGLIFEKYEVMPLIKKNSTLPCAAGTIGSSLEKFQPSVLMSVYRTEYTEPKEKDKLGQLLLPINPRPHLVNIVILFELDIDGVLKLSSSEVNDASPLYKEFLKNNQLNIELVKRMEERGELEFEAVEININK